ncbi:sugar isomerase (SIS) [Isosphaera pallida ATCC 43644]|uniref:Sugar isomerase (SIS) n=1 Tax=Isosphaera pallida (strain ATCC 43644 / DSM 9630 / IS1B) TaxID=575540 RepID=E8R2D3_ISOPI|nr:SIS domain-containing protein [Isosphaera pallida]ADV61418.1 sugar isomerase (SIS) [Isosphaera pallida ATCC 43644]
MLGVHLGLVPYLQRVCQELGRLEPQPVYDLCDHLERAYQSRAMIFVIGNGGSGANASHLCEDLNKCTLRDFENQSRLRVLSLTDNTPGITAWANDEGYDRIFVEQLKTYASPGDVLIAISGSGNSPNILKAVEWANANGLTTFGMTGFSGGKLKTMAHKTIHVAIDDMGIAESIHQVVFHWVVDDIYRRISGPIAQASANSTD